MKKRFYQIIALLCTVSILTVSASANFSNCGAIKDNENSIWNCLMTVHSNYWKDCISKICDQTGLEFPMKKCLEADKDQPNSEIPKVDTPATEQPATETPETEAPVTDQPATEVPVTAPPVTDHPSTEAPVTQPEQSNDILAYEAEVIALVNNIRESYGLSTMTANAELCRVARYKSQDMINNHYFSHTSPTYGSPFDMMKNFGISYRTAGENIAYGYTTPEAVVDGWMNSEGHRKNILNASFTEIGVGYVSDGHYWTQMFIG